MTAIETQISTFTKAASDSADVIIEGTDEHLDLLLSVINPLDKLTAKFVELNESLAASFGNRSRKEWENSIHSLKQLNKICLLLDGAIRSSANYKDVRSAYKKFNTQ